jgi:hypothetical protein
MPKISVFLPIAFLFICFAPKAQLQDQYVKATVHFTDGKTITAAVLNEETEKLNNSISIKDSSNKKSKTTYSAYDIRSIEFENGKKFRQITFTPHGSEDTLTVLGRLIVTGKIDLLQVYYKNEEILIAIRDGEPYPMQKDEFTSLDRELKYHHYNAYLLSALRDAPDAIREKTAKTDFDQKDISKLFVEYNKLYDNPVEILKTTNQNKKFFIAGVLFKKTKENPYGFFGFINYRLYVTDFSRSTSLNTGIHFYNYQSKTIYSPTQTITSTRTIASIPIFVQQNLLNKAVRPYLFAGLNATYVHEKTDDRYAVTAKGFQRNYGVNMLGGAGIEINIISNLMLKADYRYENVAHGFMGGVAFLF